MKLLSILILSLLYTCSEPAATVVLPKAEETSEVEEPTTLPPNVYIINTGGCIFRDSLKVDSVGDNLFKDRKGNLFFKTYDVAKHIYPVLILRLYNGCEGDSTYDLANYIDIPSFHRLNRTCFFKDNKHIYIHNEMSDGGNIGLITKADLRTFTAIPNSRYALDKQHVYYQGMWIEGADSKTFQGIYKIAGKDTICWFGKDKMYYYDGPDTCAKAKVDEYLSER